MVQPLAASCGYLDPFPFLSSCSFPILPCRFPMPCRLPHPILPCRLPRPILRCRLLCRFPILPCSISCSINPGPCPLFLWVHTFVGGVTGCVRDFALLVVVVSCGPLHFWFCISCMWGVWCVPLFLVHIICRNKERVDSFKCDGTCIPACCCCS